MIVITRTTIWKNNLQIISVQINIVRDMSVTVTQKLIDFRLQSEVENGLIVIESAQGRQENVISTCLNKRTNQNFFLLNLQIPICTGVISLKS